MKIVALKIVFLQKKNNETEIYINNGKYNHDNGSFKCKSTKFRI